MITEKKCKCCGEVKPLTAFYKHETGKDGYRNSCITCIAQKQKERKLEQRSKRLAQKALEDSLKTTRVCTGCGIDKPFEMFHKNVNGKYGLSPRCKTCTSEQGKQRLLENPDKNKLQCKNWSGRQSPEYKAKQAAYRKANKEARKEYAKKHYLENKERLNEISRENYLDNKDRYRKTAKLWRVANRSRANALAMKYHASKLSATPDWLSKEQISEINDLYAMVQMFKLYTGTEYHVDHIVPLQGETVCGLHVPWNLQLLPWDENISKGNRHWPDMPE